MATAAFAASPVPVGSYSGTTDEGQSSFYTIDFDVDADGRVGNLEMPGSVCSTPGIPYVGMPWTPVQPDGTFEAEWVASDITFMIEGTITADGVADGTARATMPGVCTGSRTTNWEATHDGGGEVPSPDPTLSLSAASLTESELASPGLTITGADFPASADVALQVNGAAAGTQPSNADGGVTFTYTSTTLAPGTYSIVASSGSVSATSSFTVTADPPVLDPQVTVAPSSLTVSEFADAGIVVSGTGFAGNTAATLDVAGQTGTPGTTNADGAVTLPFSGTLPVGTYTATISAGGLSDNATFQITADPVDPEPELTIALSPTSVTQSELADPGVQVSGSGFPGGATVELQVGGATVESGTATDAGAVTFTYTAADAQAGTLAVSLVSGPLSIGASLTVTADEVEPEPQPEIDLAIGEISQSDLADGGIPVTVSGLGANAAYSVLLDGALNQERTADADGNDEFIFTVADAAPGVYTLRVQVSDDVFAETTFTVTADEVDPEPQPTIELSLTEITQTQLATEGLTITGENFAAGADFELAIDGTVVDTASSDDDGNLELTYVAADVEPGTYGLTVADAVSTIDSVGILAILAETEFEVLADPVDPPVDTIAVSLDVDEITVSDLADTGVTVTGTGFAAGADVALVIDGDVISEFTADADGVAVITAVRENATPGEYTIALVADAGSAEAVLTVVADAVIPVDPTPVDPTPTDPTTPPAPAGGSGDALATTGSETAGAAILALVLLMAGGVLVALRLRRRQGGAPTAL